AKADAAATQAALDSARADLDRAEKYLKRLQNADKRSIVEANLDSAISDEKQARARVQENEARYEQAKASIKQIEALIQKTQADLKLTQINLGYTEIRSPIAGRVGKAMLTKGNYVSPGSGLLAQVVQMDPIRVVFSMSDREYVSILQANKNSVEDSIQIKLQLPNGTPYGTFGVHDFDDNQMDSKTGTIPVHARFDNPDGFLVPNSYISVSLHNEKSNKAPIVPQESILSEGGQDFVYVVDANDSVEKRKVVLGAKIDDYQCVSSGLQVGEKVVSQGLQKVKPGQKIVVAQAPKKGDA
ncbi:efflux RND transporter periplasmic adaptor subunit, partial [bacterium]|nr:efflux RND transporter periplasmic adaptor subunit [bacterium]